MFKSFLLDGTSSNVVVWSNEATTPDGISYHRPGDILLIISLVFYSLGSASVQRLPWYCHVSVFC